MELIRFENSIIAIDHDNRKVNATDMAKRYNKRPVDFLRLKETRDFISALESDVSENHFTYETVKGNYKDGKTQGTWMGELLALRFAAWLEPRLEVLIYKSFLDHMKNKLYQQQMQLDYFWDKEDIKDLYNR